MTSGRSANSPGERSESLLNSAGRLAFASAEVRRRWARRLPPLRLPLAYFVFAHLCLGTAFAVMAADPWSIAGFYYHPRMLVVVHLITLGWITCSILGALYLVAPMALGTRLPARRGDWWGLALVAAGAAGMVGHFWIDEASGMAGSALLLTVGLVLPARSFLRPLASAKLPFEVKLPFYLAFGNLFLAAFLGVLIGIDKTVSFLPAHVHGRVFAHAHLAVIGWAITLVIAVCNRLLPMLLPAAMPRGRGLWLGAVVLEGGVLGLFVTLLLGSRGSAVFAGVIVLGLATFFWRVGWMLRHRRPAAKARPKFDLTLCQIALALGYLVVGIALGMALATQPAGAWIVPAAMAYGVAALLGFLAQIVVAITPRLWSINTWMWASAGNSFRARLDSPYELSSPFLRAAILGLWTVGMPALALGLAAERIALFRAAAVWLLLAVVLQAVDLGRIVRHAFPCGSRVGSSNEILTRPRGRA